MHDDGLDPSCKNLAESFSGEEGYSILRRDDTLQAEIWLALWQADDMEALDISDIDVTVQQCEVWLAGKVEDAQALQLAECLVKAIHGVQICHNELIAKKTTSSD